MSAPLPPEPGVTTIGDVVAARAARCGDKPFLIEPDGRTLTFGEAAVQSRHWAAALLARGTGYGERVAIQAPNGIDWVLACLGAQLIGAIMVPVSTRFTGRETAQVLEKTRARVLVTVGSFLGNAYAARLQDHAGAAAGERPVGGLAHLAQIVLLDRGDQAVGGIGGKGAFLAERAAQEAVDAAAAQVTGDSVADILFTSGTTGVPKGAMHSHRQQLAYPLAWAKFHDLREDDRMVIVNPFFHAFGYRAGWYTALHCGMTAFPLAAFDAESLMATIARERISVLMAAPPVFSDILDHPRRGDYDLTSLRTGHTGSANISPMLMRRVKEELRFDVFMTAFGMTEATALVTCTRPGDSPELVATTAGRAIPGVELKLLRPADFAGHEGAGELLVRGPNVMLGYFEEPEATAAAIDAQGWLHTGDVATIDAGGYVRIVDRLKDMVIVGGFNAYPAEIEQVLLQHPAIAEAAVVGVPDARLGEVCAACVVLRPGASLELAELTAWARERLSNYKVPRHLIVRETLPRTPLGKIQRFVLRAETRAALATAG